MIRFGLLLTAASVSLLSACVSKNNAPVVYGTDPNARIVSSRSTIEAEKARAAAAYAASPYTARQARASFAYDAATQTGVTPAVATSGAAPLTPVAENWSQGRTTKPSLPSAPQYLTATDSAPERLARPSDQPPGQVTVLPGDTVYAISRRTGASPQAIIALNRLEAPYTLTIGDRLRVPASSVPPSRAAAEPVIVNASASTAAPRHAAPRDGAHVVRAGETLYSISRATGVDVNQLARANAIRSPYTISIGRTLRIPGRADAAPAPKSGPKAAPQREAAAKPEDITRNVSYTAPTAKATEKMFDRPVQGAIIGNFGFASGGKRNDGVNIAAPVGTPVRAAADGEVVYRGSELQGYGNLLLVKHADGFVTAYAHNDAMLVKKGDHVHKGQVIAKVGKTGTATEPQLHFEIRQNLKAIDPVALIGAL